MYLLIWLIVAVPLWLLWSFLIFPLLGLPFAAGLVVCFLVGAVIGLIATAAAAASTD